MRVEDILRFGTGTGGARPARTWTPRRAAAAASAAAAMVLAGCTTAEPTSESTGGEIVITCSICEPISDVDPIGDYRHAVATRFNEEFAGQYRIEFVPHIDANTPEGVQQLSRLALVGELPDLFHLGEIDLMEMDASAGVMDFRPWLDADPEFRDTFFPEMIQSSRTEDRLLFVPAERSPIGVFWNTQILADAGFDAPPTTWEGFVEVAEAVSADGGIPLAMDGQFTTLTWVMHLIGTQPDGAEYLSSGRTSEEGIKDEHWVEAVEQLKEWHLQGFVNEDAFTGDFERASQPFLSGQAAAITSGPWYAPVIASENAAPGLAEHVVYTPAPGDGVAIAGRGSGWASGAVETEEQEAVWAFIKFAYTWDEQLQRTMATSSFPPVKGEFDEAARAQLDPLAVSLYEASAGSAHVYPHLEGMPATLWDEWVNYWPAYVQGSMDTETFLTSFQ